MIVINMIRLFYTSFAFTKRGVCTKLAISKGDVTEDDKMAGRGQLWAQIVSCGLSSSHIGFPSTPWAPRACAAHKSIERAKTKRAQRQEKSRAMNFSSATFRQVCKVSKYI